MKGISHTNWNKPTPARWRNIGDALLVSIPLLTGFIMQSPLPEGAKSWLIFLSNLALVGGKFVTKLFGEDKPQYDDKLN
jgi:hypothetical protein